MGAPRAAAKLLGENVFKWQLLDVTRYRQRGVDVVGVGVGRLPPARPRAGAPVGGVMGGRARRLIIFF